MTTKSSRKQLDKSVMTMTTNNATSKGLDSTMSRNTRTTTNTASDKLLMQTNKPIIQVFLSGKDVTPIPLVEPDVSHYQNRRANPIDGKTMTSNDFMATSTFYQNGNKKSYGGPFTRSVFSSQSGRSGVADSAEDNESVSETHIACNWNQTTNHQTIYHRSVDETVELTEAQLNSNIDITLSETDTIWLLDIIGTIVSNENEEYSTVMSTNESYKELLKSRLGNDRYVERGMNTFNQLPKFKSIQTNSITHVDQGTMCTNWDMFDSYDALQKIEIAEALAATENIYKGDNIKDEKKKSIVKTQDELDENSLKTMEESSQTKKTLTSQDTQISMMSMNPESMMKNKERGQAEIILGENKILQSDQLRQDLVIMDRVINLNTYQQKLASFRNFPIIYDIDKDYTESEEDDQSLMTNATPVNKNIVEKDGEQMQPTPNSLEQQHRQPKKTVNTLQRVANLERLWTYHCSITKGRNVSCISWNKSNPDLLAVCYGQYDFSKQKKGMICCWSLKNPEFPERIYHTRCGVTSLSWSNKHHNLLAAGLYNGTIAIYNVRTPGGDSILDSLDSLNKHIDPVWQLCWIEKDRGTGDDKAEVLVSISTDGRVSQWSIRKGFECYDLMKLKKMIQKQPGQIKTKKAEAFISRYAGGLCFAFTPTDTNIYLVGTEEGHIHRCSCSYNEQYLESYFGHTGPVYKIVWSPFCPELFLSCSGDWSIRLWHQDYPEPIITLLSSTRGVPDITWSTTCATVFVCVNEGAIEVWDLSLSILDPVVVNAPPTSATLSTVSFCLKTQCFVVGDSDGHIAVYQLADMPQHEDDQSKALLKIVRTCLATRLHD